MKFLQRSLLAATALLENDLAVPDPLRNNGTDHIFPKVHLYQKILFIFLNVFLALGLLSCFYIMKSSKYKHDWREEDVVVTEMTEEEHEANGASFHALGKFFYHRVLRTEVFLARHGQRVSFLIMCGIIIVICLSYGVYLETISYPNKANELLAIAIPIGRAFGVMCNFTTFLLLLCMCRIPLTWLSGTRLAIFLPLEETFELHVIFGLVTLCGGVLHGILQTVNFATNPNKKQTWEEQTHSVVFGGTSTFVSGWMITLVFLIMALTYFKPVKLLFGYQGFLNAHKLWIVFLILMYFHGNRKGSPQFWKWAIFPTLLIFLHYASVKFGKAHVKTVAVLEKCFLDEKAKVIRLEVLRRNYKFKAGQYAFIKIKELGNEKHPFTIASSPIENTVTFFIKVAGDWTESLYQLLEERKSSKNPKQIECILTGGYGAPSQFTYQFKDVVFVGTSVGATPFLSLTKDILLKKYVQDFLDSTANELALDQQQAMELVTKYQHEFSHVDYKKLQKIKGAKRWKYFNTYSYGCFWQIYLLVIFAAFIAGDPDIFESSDEIVNVLPDIHHYEQDEAWADLAWTIVSGINYFSIFVGYSIDIVYRILVERHIMSKRQKAELFFHLPLWVASIAVPIISYALDHQMYISLIKRGQWALGMDLGNFVFLLCLLISSISWYQYSRRISGYRLDNPYYKEASFDEQVCSIKVILIDRKHDNATWMIDELKNIEKLSGKAQNLKFDIDIYFTRDEEDVQNTVFENSTIIKSKIGRPIWDNVVDEITKKQESDEALDKGIKVELGCQDPECGNDECKQETLHQKVTGLFFCGNMLVGNTIRNSIGKRTAGTENHIVWHMESFG